MCFKKTVKCEECKHLIARCDAQLVHFFREKSVEEYGCLQGGTVVIQKTEKKEKFYCPMHRKNYDVEIESCGYEWRNGEYQKGELSYRKRIDPWKKVDEHGGEIKQ